MYIKLFLLFLICFIIKYEAKKIRYTREKLNFIENYKNKLSDKEYNTKFKVEQCYENCLSGSCYYSNCQNQDCAGGLCLFYGGKNLNCSGITNIFIHNY